MYIKNRRNSTEFKAFGLYQTMCLNEHMKKKLLNIEKWLILGIICSIQISCNIIPCGWTTDLTEVNEKPNSDFIIGIYRLDERTINFIPGYEKAGNAELNLKKDGTLEIKDTPIGTFDFMDYYDENDQNVNVIGKWKIRDGKDTAELSVDLNFEEKYSELNTSTSWKIYEKDEKPVIFIILGDPDSCASARFIKTTE